MLDENLKNPNLEWAQWYLEVGFSVIPLKPQGKEPLIPWKDFQSRKPTTEEIQSWFDRWPDANIGIVTGEISGIIVLDIDGSKGFQSLAGKDFPSTWVSKTGNGEHRFFLHPGGRVQNFTRFFDGVDLRADGGYVVAVPSVHPNGNKYNWRMGPNHGIQIASCPTLLLDGIQNPSGSKSTTGKTSESFRKVLPNDPWAKFLSGVKEGKRHDTALKLAGRYIGKGLGQEEAELILSGFGERCNPPLELSEISRIVADIHARESQPYPETVPWPEPVQARQVLDEIVSVLGRYVIVPPHAEIAIALWVIHCWCLDAFMISPLLRIKSPTKGCGKTRLLSLISKMLPKNVSSANVTTATVFRLVDKFQVTLCVDEADCNLKNNSDLIALINSGYTRETSDVLRCVGDQHDVKKFSTWGGKALAGIGSLPSTTESRSIQVFMKKKKKNEIVERLRADCSKQFEPLKRKCKRIANDHTDNLRNCDPEIPRELDDRQADNWRPLIAIADLVEGDWPNLARQAAVVLSCGGKEDETSLRELLLADLREIFNRANNENGYDRLPTSHILQNLEMKSESPWAGYHNGKPITDRGLAGLLKDFKIKSKDIRWGEHNFKGYYFSHFEDSFARYL